MHAALLEAVKKSIGAADSDSLDGCSVKVVRKSFDGRWKKKNEPYFVYTVDLEVPKNVQKRFPRLTVRQGKIDLLDVDRDDSVPLTRNRVDATEVIAIVGAGPAGKIMLIDGLIRISRFDISVLFFILKVSLLPCL